MSVVAVSSTVAAALEYASAGWRIWPVRPRTKRPLCPHGSSEATADLEQVKAWWRMWSWANIGGIVPGGLVVVDLDERNGCRLRPEHFAATLTTRTGNGHHLWFKAPVGVELPGHLDVPEWRGVDLIAAGRGVVLPPSIHPNGRRYEWIGAAIGRTPATVVDAFAMATRTPYNGSCAARGSGLLERLQRHLDELAATGPGNRNRKTGDVAFFAGRIAAGGQLDEAEAEALVLEHCPIGADFPEREAAGVVRRGVRDGARQPLGER